MGEQVAQGDVALGLAQLGLAAGIEAFEHAHVTKGGQDSLGRRVQAELAAFDLLHGRGAGHRLGHGRDPADGVGGHLGGLAQHALAEAAFVGLSLAVGRDSHHARYVALGDRLLQNFVSLCLHGVSSCWTQPP